MSEQRENFWAIIVAVVLLVASLFFGLLWLAVVILAGAAAIQAGILGFRRTGYSFGTHRVTG
jgi:hypothetical protein